MIFKYDLHFYLIRLLNYRGDTFMIIYISQVSSNGFLHWTKYCWNHLFSGKHNETIADETRKNARTRTYFYALILFLSSIDSILRLLWASRLTVKIFYKKYIWSSCHCCARLCVWLCYNSWKLPKLFRMLLECRRTTKTKRIISLFSLGLYLFLVLGD